MVVLPAPYQAALRGDLRGLGPWLHTLAQSPSPEAASWASAARMLWSFAQPDRCARPDLRSVESGPASDALAEALWLDARAYLLELRTDAARAVQERLGGLRSERAQMWAMLLAGHLAAIAGEPDAGHRMAEKVYTQASQARWPVLAVEAILLRAVSRMEQGEISAATADARRAARMAQTEHLWLTHYMTSLLLARLRRLGGRAHLAGLVASACLKVTGPVFVGALGWELLMAGVRPPQTAAGNPAEHALELAAAILCAGEQAHAAELIACVVESAPHRADADAFLSAISLDRSPRDLRVQAWLDGTTNETPPSLCGLTPPSWAGSAADALPFAVGTPSGSRRLLGFALSESTPRIAPRGARAARPEALAAALTLTGREDVEQTVLFERVYGFPYRKEIHAPSFNVVRHHAKKLLEPFAEIIGDGERLSLRVMASFAVPDPRCHEPLQEALLRFLTSSRGLSAKELSERLGVSTRTVQLALRDLTEDGACVSTKEGRQVAYSVEDTTFCELTVA